MQGVMTKLGRIAGLVGAYSGVYCTSCFVLYLLLEGDRY